MAKIKQQKKTELQNNLAKKTKQIRDKIKALPAYPRRKKDEKNWETFFVTFAFISLTGIMIFGNGFKLITISTLRFFERFSGRFSTISSSIKILPFPSMVTIILFLIPLSIILVWMEDARLVDNLKL